MKKKIVNVLVFGLFIIGIVGIANASNVTVLIEGTVVDIQYHDGHVFTEKAKKTNQHKPA